MRALLVIAAVLIASGCAAIVLLTLSRISHAAYFLDRAGRSYEQLALVTKLEADMQALLLDSGVAALARSPSQADSVTHRAQEIERGLALYLASIQGEHELMRKHGEAADDGGEAEEAVALRAVFEALLKDSNGMASPARVQLDSQPSAASSLFATRVEELRGRVHQIVARERREIEETMSSMTAMRRGYFRLGLLVASATVLGLIAILLYLNAAVVAPIAVLRSGAERIGQGDLSVRVQSVGPRDVAELGGQFNDMAQRLADQHAALQASHDMLEHTVAERTRELEAKTGQLEQIDRTRRLFFAKLGHELRTPVTVLRGEAEVALRDRHADVDSLREALLHIVANGDALHRRLEDLLALARSEDGRIALDRQCIDLARCARRAAAQATAFAASNGVKLVFDDAPQQAYCHGDESWLRQALLALIDNAVKFSPSGGVVTVRLLKTGRESSIEVSDEGPGVSEPVVQRLFEPYVQDESGLRRGGSGLGLAVARWVMEQHDGRIAAGNRDGGGFVVTMSIPLKDEGQC